MYKFKKKKMIAFHNDMDIFERENQGKEEI